MVYYFQKHPVGRDIRHRCSKVCIADHAGPIDHGDQRHAAQLENTNFLLVTLGNFVPWIWQTDERESLGAPVQRKSVAPIGPHGKDLGTARFELPIVVPQTRQLRAAEGSQEAAQEGKDDRLTTKIGKMDAPTESVRERKVRSGFSALEEVRHGRSTLSP